MYADSVLLCEILWKVFLYTLGQYCLYESSNEYYIMKTQTVSGRPPKFQEESTPITVTLPRRILNKISLVDGDRAKGIVKCVESFFRKDEGQIPVQIQNVSECSGLIVVGSAKSLQKISWLKMIEIAPSKFLLSVPPGTAVESLEIAVEDLIDDLSHENLEEKDMLVDLHRKIRHYRRKKNVTKGEILLVKTAFSLVAGFVLKNLDVLMDPEFFCLLA